jgi:hypothetical protein
LATVRLSRVGQDKSPVIDLLFASSGIEAEIVAQAEPIELVPGLTIGVAQVGHLIALKVLARNDVSRPLDRADLRALLQVAADTELTRARDALSLITSRGYHRGRDLLSEFASSPHRSGGRFFAAFDGRLLSFAPRHRTASVFAVEEALRLLVQTKGQAVIRRLRGQVDWDGDLEVSRVDRVSPSR